MNTKHTPGPWSAEAAMSSDIAHIRYITADGKIIASVRFRNEQTMDQALANARLIAAAPELLEALVGVMDRLVDKHETDEAAVAARAAIAKATGEQA